MSQTVPFSVRAGFFFQICAVQMGKGLSGVSAEQMDNVVIAYEPVSKRPGCLYVVAPTSQCKSDEI